MAKKTVEHIVQTRLPLDEGEFTLHLYLEKDTGKEHLALVKGSLNGKTVPLVRLHSECFTGDVLGSRRCDCGSQLKKALTLIGKEESGILMYMRQEGRGIGLAEKLKAYNLQDRGLDTVDANLRLGHSADDRDYEAASLILKDLHVSSIRLLTNNPAKIDGLQKYGIKISDRIPLVTAVHDDNYFYLSTKVKRMKHIINLGQL